MPADITQQDGEWLVAVNWERGNPWHQLGKVMLEDMAIEEALELVKADDVVEPVTLYTHNSLDVDQFEEVEGFVGIYSNIYGTISVASPSYEITQRREILELAYDIVGLSPEHAHIDTIGNLGQRADTFFSYIRVPDLVIDETGIGDRIERGLFVATSFDGSMANTIGYSNIRAVCRNTVTMALGNLQQAIRVKHTRNSEERMKEAAVALQYVGAVEKQMVAQAEKMLKVNGTRAVKDLKDHFWPISDADLPEKTKTRRITARDTVQMLYNGDGNTASSVAGENGWAAYNAVVEYFDYYQPTRGAENIDVRRARNAVLPGDTTNKKLDASRLVLSLNDN